MALLPLSAFGGKAKPGDTVTVRVVKLHDSGEVEVEVAEAKDEEPEADASEMVDDNEMAEMKV